MRISGPSALARRAGASLFVVSTLVVAADARFTTRAAGEPDVDAGNVSTLAGGQELPSRTATSGSHAASPGAMHASAASSPTPLTRTRSFPEGARQQLTYSDEGDGSTWVRGLGFKARFGPGGATYVPFFGSRAPRNHPLELSLTRFEANGAEVELTPATEVTRDGDRFVIHRGPLDERYDVRLDHVEQSFVVRELPAARSLDLYVALPEDYRAFPDESGVELRCEAGSVRYGRAFVVERDGSRAVLATDVVEGALRIHVGPDVLERAQYPLVIDPIVSTFQAESFVLDMTEGDISYDVTSDRYLLATEESFSGADGDVRCQLIDPAGLIFTAFADSSTENWRGPQTANLRNYQQFLCVAQANNVVGSTGWVVRGRTIGTPAYTSGPKINISTPDQTGDKVLPDVGGDPFGGNAYYCVVWHRTFSSGDTDIHARLVSDTSVLVGSSTILVDNSSNTLDSWPSISKTNGPVGANAAWTIAWHRQSSTYDVHAARLDYNGSILNPSALIASSANDDYYPRVSTPLADGTVAVVYAQRVGAQHDIHYATLSGTTVTASGNLSALDAPAELSRDQVEYSIDADGVGWVVAFTQEKAASPGDYDTFVTSFVPYNGNDVRVIEGHLPVDTTAARSARTDVASKWSVGGPSSRSRMLWDVDPAVGATVVWIADYQRPAGGTTQAFCFGDGTGTTCPCANNGAAGRGCANSASGIGAQLVASGQAQTGVGDTVQLTLLATPGFAPCLLFQGTNGGNGIVFGDGLLCVSGGLRRLAIHTANSLGTTQWPSGADPSLSTMSLVPGPGAELRYQAYYRDSASFCTPSTFNTSNGVRILWLP